MFAPCCLGLAPSVVVALFVPPAAFVSPCAGDEEEAEVEVVPPAAVEVEVEGFAEEAEAAAAVEEEEACVEDVDVLFAAPPGGTASEEQF